MQRKNFIQFLIAAAIFILGLQWLMPKLFPPPPKLEEKKAEPEAKVSDRAFGLLPRDWLREQNLFGLVPGSWVFEQKLFGLVPESWVESAQPVEPMLFGGLLRKRFLDKALVAAAEARAAKEARERRRLPHVRLGSDDPDSDYHLLVEFDPRGASVYRIVLNKFKGTTDVGKPTNELLELVPPDTDGFLNSNLLYHYDTPKAEHPLDTLGKRVWSGGKKVEDSDGRQSISFSTDIQGVRITKTFTLEPHSYHLGLAVKLEVTDPKRKGEKFRYQLTSGHLLPIDGPLYASTFRHSLIGRVRGNDVWRDYQDIREVALKQGGESVTPEEGKFIQYAGVAVQYFASVIVVDDDQDKRDFLASARPLLEARVVKIELEEEGKNITGDLVVHDKKDKTKKEVYHLPFEVRFLVNQMHKGARFNMLVVPDAEFGLKAVRLLREAEAQPLFLDDMTARVNTEPVELGDKPVIHKYLLYNGPIKTMLLGQMKGQASVPEDLVQRYTDTLHLNTLTDYQSNGWLGSFSSSIYWTNLLIFFTNLMHRVLWGLHNIIPSYGICIILLTVLVRGLMFPISRKQALTSMKMQELAPELKKLQQKHKDDPRARTEEMMALYRKHGVNPFGSCWMLLLQMPIFMGLYYALQESVHFRLAGFLWMENLAAPDMLIRWGDKIPWISRPEDYGGLLYLGPYFNLLPVLAVTLMIFQQKLLMPPPTDEQQAMQQKMMKWMMIFFGLLFYKVAAGLCIYFIASSLWGFAERKLLPKKKPTTDGATADSLFQKMVSGPSPEPATSEAVTPAPVGNGDSYLSNRARKRQERKRRQERFQAQASARVERVEAPPPPRRPADDGEAGGWWARTRRKISNWWKDVLKKASKK
jgi:YidC/Oxa1 family membrane protein insertase